MTHKPIIIRDLTLSFPHKTCFRSFSIQVPHGSRIAIIGRNGSGKSSLLQALAGHTTLIEGDVLLPPGARIGYVPQIIEDGSILSGGTRLKEAITTALSAEPDILLLDEPTNHLDRHNRQGLLRMLAAFGGTLIIVSHDTELLRHRVDTLWHIDNTIIKPFSGNYDHYMQQRRLARASIEQEISRLGRQKKETHLALMKEQERAKKSNMRGEKSIKERKWPTIVSDEKARRAIETSGRKKAAIVDKKTDLVEQLHDLRLPEVIVPKFAIDGIKSGVGSLVSIHGGGLAYHTQDYVLRNVELQISSLERIAVTGDNASGKSTLIKAIMADNSLIKHGIWQIPQLRDIGYIDQHYSTLLPEKSVAQTIADVAPQWDHAMVRRHLNDFLFRKNEEVMALVSQLSGGEKARLSLAQIAAKRIKLLILDEITNNVDLETRTHIIQVLRAFPGAILVISHDEDFLDDINIDGRYHINNGRLSRYIPSILNSI
ncbi:MAG: ABC-F family ATP-binding cassette domain-containing protein [Proteobacteria bacterium]|nr:ABC-F family ATP-binding cassette domain-containing protein [Pseudomonadota bacterium]